MHLEILPPERPATPELLVPELEQRSARGAAAGRGGGRGLAEDDHPGRGDHRRAQGPGQRRRPRTTMPPWPASCWPGSTPTTSPSSATASTRCTATTQDNYTIEPVPATGLGILRADADAAGAFHALPQPNTRHYLMIITKDNYRSRIHRPAYLDYLGFRIFDADGKSIGERRFLGLFSSSAYSESVSRVPVVRQKAPPCSTTPATTSTATAARPCWTSSRAIRATSCSRPRGPSWPRSWRRSPTSRNAARCGCSSAATRTAATCPAWSTCRATATPPRSASGWRTC